MKRNNLFNKIFSGSVILSLCLIPLNLTSCSKRNPHEYIKSKDVINSINSIRRLDKDGKLYFMENTMDYRNNKEIVSTIEDWEWNEKIDMNFGCSVFMTPSISNDIETTLTGRAYDLLHLYKDINENIKLGNTNLMIHTPKDESKGIYHESIGTCDALIFYPEKLTFEEVDAGLLDNQKTDLSYLALSPYYTVDGINDAGLTASILILANEGDIPKENIIEQKDAKKIKKPIQKYKCQQLELWDIS